MRGRLDIANAPAYNLAVHTDPDMRARARRLRRDATDAERALWRRLRGKQLDGLKFRRQHVVGRFVLDFYCHECRLAVELDGGQHGEAAQKRRDAARTAFLESKGVAVLRYSNLEALREIAAVLDDLRRHAAARRRGRSGPPSPNPSRKREGGR